jgi:hypothetical protein
MSFLAGFAELGSGSHFFDTAFNQLKGTAERITEDWPATCDYNCGMDALFYSISLALFVLAILTFVLVIRETFPLLEPEDKTLLRNYWVGTVGFDTWRKRDRAIKRAWNEHGRSFPKSRKRLLFAAFLIAAAISVIGYPVWLALGGR